MAIIASGKGGGDFELCPTGNIQAVCAFVEDVGHEHSDLNSTWTHKVVILWELAEKMRDGRPFMLSKSYTISLHEKASLRKELASWRGKDFTPAELDGFDLEKLLNVNCLLNVVAYKKRDGSEGRKIASVSPIIKGMNLLIPVNEKCPDWVSKRRDENEAAYSKSDAVPVVVTGLAEDVKKLAAAPVNPADDHHLPPF